MLNITLAAPQRHHALTVFPLLTSDEAELPYDLLVDALQAQTLTITEVGEGSVPELLAIHAGEQDLLILDGEQLIGARQNRMINRSILLPGRSKTKITVSCMEQGRWHFTSDHFAPTPFNAPGVVRRRARESEAEYAEAGMAPPPEALRHAQQSVWSAIHEHQTKLGGRSETGALNDLYTQRSADLEQGEKHFPHVQGQVGLLAFVGEQPLGLDVIGGLALYARLHERLLRGYLMDALGAPPARGEIAAATAQNFLDRARAAQRVPSPTVGRGSYSVLAREVIGGELLDEERVAHLAAFPLRSFPGSQAGRAEELERPLPPPSQRRRRG